MNLANNIIPSNNFKPASSQNDFSAIEGEPLLNVQTSANKAALEMEAIIAEAPQLRAYQKALV